MVRYRFFLYAGLLPYLLGAAWAWAIAGTFDAPSSGAACPASCWPSSASRRSTNTSTRAWAPTACSIPPTCRRSPTACSGAGWSPSPRRSPSGVYLALHVGWPIIVFALLGGMAAIFYEAPPIRWSYRGLGELVIALSYGPWMVLGSLYLHTRALSWARVRGIARAGAAHHVARGRQRDPRLSPGPPRRQAQPRRAPRPRAAASCSTSRWPRRHWPSSPSARSPACFPSACLAALARAAAARRERAAARAARTRRRAQFVPAIRSIVACYAAGGDAVHRSACSCTGCATDASHRQLRRAALRVVAAHARLRPRLPALLHRFGAGQAPAPTSSTPTKRCAWPTRSCEAACRTSCCAAASRSSCRTSSTSPKRLGRAGIDLKIETNGQQLRRRDRARGSPRLPIRSIQVSLDGDTQEVYERQRPGASLAKAHAACRAVRDAGLPLEVTFAPTRINIHEARSGHRARPRARGVPLQLRQADAPRDGRAPVEQARADARRSIASSATTLARAARILEPPMELCYVPWSIEDGLARCAGGTAGDAAGASQRLGQGGGGASRTSAPICGARRSRRPGRRTARPGANEATRAAMRRAIDDESSHAAGEHAGSWMPVVHV